jgi:hypothetical protein
MGREGVMALAVDWINIADFSPGIFADLHGGIAAGSRGSVLTNGAATIDGTYRCCADPSGALVPLPAATTVQTAISIPDAVTYGTSGFPATFPGAYVLEAQVIGPVHRQSAVRSHCRSSAQEHRRPWFGCHSSRRAAPHHL